jgi:hypothetical protein
LESIIDTSKKKKKKTLGTTPRIERERERQNPDPNASSSGTMTRISRHTLEREITQLEELNVNQLIEKYQKIAENIEAGFDKNEYDENDYYQIRLGIKILQSALFKFYAAEDQRQEYYKNLEPKLAEEIKKSEQKDDLISDLEKKNKGFEIKVADLNKEIENRGNAIKRLEKEKFELI